MWAGVSGDGVWHSVCTHTMVHWVGREAVDSCVPPPLGGSCSPLNLRPLPSHPPALPQPPQGAAAAWLHLTLLATPSPSPFPPTPHTHTLQAAAAAPLDPVRLPGHLAAGGPAAADLPPGRVGQAGGAGERDGDQPGGGQAALR